jgi:hypothetical protein
MAKAMLVQCVWAATRSKGTYLHAQYIRLRSRRGPKKSDLRGCCFHPYRRLSHAQGWHIL